MENVKHAEEKKALQLKHFGKPIVESPLQKSLQKFGLARAYSPIDLDFVHSMLPSRMISKTDDDSNEEGMKEAIQHIEAKQAKRKDAAGSLNAISEEKKQTLTI